MKRFVVLHPLAATDATVLVAGGLLALASWGLLRLADHLDRRLVALTDLGGED